eukprot:gnl/TRDRNA2_/TRDRNA2_82893_c0_seq2.p1 gnl/TRDRNA2_/TRDRNA2_82893_c0~~gnl/TRDRNA2_/TRDRNA2_82893_c0_seq2.p1  ORF type:complete len:455 (+),score=75.94 gnl/TRDRNA2_/TRDRNA2_82893_c0_seq2:53-1417(+)
MWISCARRQPADDLHTITRQPSGDMNEPLVQEATLCKSTRCGGLPKRLTLLAGLSLASLLVSLQSDHGIDVGVMLGRIARPAERFHFPHGVRAAQFAHAGWTWHPTARPLVYPAAAAAADDKLPLTWVEVADVPDVEPSEDAQIMPVFPLNSIVWPGSDFSLNIIDPAYRRMYDDILLSGSRRFVVPWSPCAPGFPRGRIRFKEIPEEERSLHAVGVVLYLEDLREVSGETNDKVKYQAKHRTVGRARITRLLNPSALFRTNKDGFKIDYLRAEVKLYEEDLDKDDIALPDNLAGELADVWKDLVAVAANMSQPILLDEETIRNMTTGNSTWKLAELWEQWQMTLHMYREKARVYDVIKEWIQEQQQQGQLPETLPPVLDVSKLGMPLALQEQLLKVQSAQGLELTRDFWEPLLRLQAAEEPRERGELLIEAAREEAKVMRARAALWGAFGTKP